MILTDISVEPVCNNKKKMNCKNQDSDQLDFTRKGDRICQMF